MKILKGFIWFTILLVTVVVCGLLYLRYCDWNPEKAAEYVTKNAEKKSVGLCAKYVRKAIVAGGIPLYQGGNAWSYKYLLPLLGFKEIEDVNDKKVGDIVVFQPIGKRYFGHIAMWNGRQWISDFKQRSIIVHSDYSKDDCKYTIFRKGE